MKLAKKYNINIYIFDCDIGIQSQLDELIKKISKEFKIIDTIINSLGMVGTEQMAG
jgi:Short-chain dehydrogenase involved in D-alanine esterification of lipoteichoic acid and wall teichoic acid (D-alanine transfer protein)